MNKTFRLSLVASVFLLSSLQGESLDDALDGFDDELVEVKKVISGDELLDGFDDSDSDSDSDDVAEEVETSSAPYSFTGKVTQQLTYSLSEDEPHDDISSLKSSLLLDYEHKFENGWKFKTNVKAYYDAIYGLKGSSKFISNLKDELESEVELFDAYIEGSITDNLDMKLGRQVVVWGRSDTIRVTDILNPLDNRRPAMVDIEDLRLPVAMAKFDFFVDDWRLTPMAIFEQRFHKNPPHGSSFYPSPAKSPEEKSYDDVTFALSVGGEFSGWDINLYVAHVYGETGYIEAPIDRLSKIEHDKITMYGGAVNILSGSWLFKSELAYFDNLKYTTVQDKEFSRVDVLAGLEYKGVADSLFSYDIVLREMGSYDKQLLNEFNPIEESTYQHAFRASSDFLNATLTANYLVSMYGKSLDKGGFQRAWIKYQISDGINTNIGIVDYIGGSKMFDSIKENDMLFADISYSF